MIKYRIDHFIELLKKFESLYWVSLEEISQFFKMREEEIRDKINLLIDKGKIFAEISADGLFFINKFKKDLINYIKDYYEVSFEKLAEFFNINEDFIEKIVKKLVLNKEIEAKLHSDCITLQKSDFEPIKCPNCHAPLEKVPPCKCEHCGFLIEKK